MDTISYFFVDKATWPDGPWKDEPDKVQYQDEETGLPCLVVRQPESGHLCGGVSEGHPAFRRDYDAVDVDVHGGLTYADFCVEDNKHHGVCHVPSPGEPDRVWWLGFDCAHCNDLSPAYSTIRYSAAYRSLDYVEQQNRNLAKQLARKSNTSEQVQAKKERA